MAEKRGYVRFPVQGVATFRNSLTGDNSITVQMVDISFLGICAYSETPLEIGAMVDFELKLSSIQDYFAGKGQVRGAFEFNKQKKKLFRISVVFTEVDKSKIQSVIERVQSFYNRQKRQRWQNGESGVGVL